MKNFITESEIEQIALDILSEDLGYKILRPSGIISRLLDKVYLKSLLIHAANKAHGQAHKARTQSQPAQELYLPDTRQNINRCDSPHMIDDRGERLLVGGGLPKYGQTETIFNFLFATVLHIQLYIIYLAFCY